MVAVLLKSPTTPVCHLTLALRWQSAGSQIWKRSSLSSSVFYFLDIYRNMEDKNIRRAVQVLMKASDNSLFAVRTELLDAFTELTKRLQSSTDQCSEVLNALLGEMEEIKEKQADLASAISKISSRQADTRFHHIYAGRYGRKTFECRVLALFAYRSLGFEFDEYTTKKTRYLPSCRACFGLSTCQI